jgi:hypothetical protein
MSALLLSAVASLVFCAPGYPGSAGDAQPLVEQFATAAADSAGWPKGSLTALYDPTEQGGLAKLASADAALAFVPYAFFVQHGSALHLTALAQADLVGIGTQERWTLVGKAGALISPPTLSGYTILSVAGYAPEFVRHWALAAWALPADVRIESTTQILSTLRRVASGEPVVALLDQTQAAALASLPFAHQLQSVLQSAPVPVAIVALVDARVPAARARSLQAALLAMGHAPVATGQAPAASDTLGPLQLQGFVLPQLPSAMARP